MPQRVAAPAFSSIGYPKRQDMILYVDGCRTQYRTRDGRVLSTVDGDIVYVPRGAEYCVSCTEQSDSSATLQINFLLFRETQQPFVFSKDITVYRGRNNRLRELFEKAILLGESARVSPNEQKIVLFELFHALARESNDRTRPCVIDRGIEYLQAHYQEDPSVSMLAELCHVSEEYFRRLFKRQMGVSPLVYKNDLRQKKAAQYLMYTEMSVSEISERLSYATPAHFIKMFKEHHGCTPLVFRAKYSQEGLP